MIIIMLFTTQSGGSMHSVLLVGLICLLIASSISCSSVRSSNNIMCLESDRNALLQFKQGLVDESNVLASWGNNKNCCEWRGIACNNQTGHVITLNLRSNSFAKTPFSEPSAETPLRGEIDPSLLELRYLNYLDLSQNNFGRMMIPKFIGSLSQLKELNLSNSNFSGPIPPQIGNLSNLHTLDLKGNYFVTVENLEWLSHLCSLRYLNMSYVDFSEVVNWPHSLSKLPSLIELRLHYCYLPDVNLRSLPFINSSTSLQVLDLAFNALNSSIFYWTANVSSNFVHIDLSYNNLQGPIPDVFFNMVSLVSLDLSRNQLEGGLPKSFQNFCRLESLSLWSNQFSENIEDFVKPLFCAQNTLESLQLTYNRFGGSWPDLTGFSKLRALDLSYNQFYGSVPESVGKLSSLEFLDLSYNQLNESVPESVGQLSSLEVLDLSNNSWNGVMTEAHFLNLSRLQSLYVSCNRLSINLSSNWNPPFQLKELELSSCKVGPDFPKWIQKQRNLTWLDLSMNQIQGKVPNLSTSLTYVDLSFNKFSGALPSVPPIRSVDLSFNQFSGALPSVPPIGYVDLSFNQFSGALPSIPPWSYVDLSFNQFSGALPSVPPTLDTLILSNNMFSRSLSSLCATHAPNLTTLDISENLLSGELPNCLMQFQGLVFLNLGKNKLSGKLPSSLGNLKELWMLRLYGNNFSGELPSFENCTILMVVDLAGNKLSGKIPTWIGPSLTNLFVLNLRSNEFNGSIPFSLCNLATIHVLDLSRNNISGALPHCFNNITSLSYEENFEYMFVEVVWKGVEIEFGMKNVALLRSIDISSNYLVGEIPESVTLMIKLKSLNLSRNKLTGKIPENFGNLKMLESLDLSRNQISGRIPASFSTLNFLGVLDVSHNHLYGRIPVSTQLQSFNASAYVGNNGLCGPPLTQNCSGDGTTQDYGIRESDNKEQDNDGLISLGLTISTVLGFITGFWIVCASLLLKSSWRYAYFKFLKDSKDSPVYKAKMPRRLQR